MESSLMNSTTVPINITNITLHTWVTRLIFDEFDYVHKMTLVKKVWELLPVVHIVCREATISLWCCLLFYFV